MFPCVRCLLSIAAICGLSGCSISPSPEYPVHRLVFDESLVGVWAAAPVEGAEHQLRLEITAREVPLLGGRVDSSGLRLRGQPAPQVTSGYRLTWAPDNDDLRLEFDAFLFEAAGRRFLGMQVSEKQLADSGVLGLVAPLHHVVRVSVDVAELRLQWPSVVVAWVANTGWVDAEPGARLSSIGE